MPVERDPDDVKEFIIESLSYLDSSEPVLAQLQAESFDANRDNSHQVAGVFRAFHSIKGVAGFLSFLNIQEVTHKAEETLDRVRTGKRKYDRELGSALLEACDLLRKYFSLIVASGHDEGLESEKATVVANLKVFCSVSTPSIALNPQNTHLASEGALFDWLLDDSLINRFSQGALNYVDAIEQQLVILLDKPQLVSILPEAGMAFEKLRMNSMALGFKAASSLALSLSESLGRPLAQTSRVELSLITVYFNACSLLKTLLQTTSPSQVMLEQVQLSQKELAKTHATPTETIIHEDKNSASAPVNPTASNSAGPKNEIRVSLERLDKMVDLIEALGAVSTGVVSSADISEDGSGQRQNAAKLKKITEELQEITVSIRMVPLSTLFRKMFRLVGDVSSKLGKKVKLEMVGEQTELDKDAAESLQDPLMHILRNCVDHGLELPEERIAAGKSETGIIQLQAWHSGGEAWISISDDGRGIARDKVLAKAIAKGLTTPSVVLTDTEVLGFLFHPGFSMAKEVTEFSGRGVGMDVVKKNIESLKGRIDLESKFGFGTSFLIRLPMANALTESMLVRVGTVKYVLRVASLRETFRPEPSSIVRLPNGDEMVQLRGRLYPVIRLHQVHSISNSETQLHRGLIMIVENRGRESGLFVDEVIGKIQAVIKPPPNLLKGSKTLAGCSIIGTESDDVALALDINALDEKMAEASKH